MLFCKIIFFEVFPVPHHTTNCLTDLKKDEKHSFWSCALTPTEDLKLVPGSRGSSAVCLDCGNENLRLGRQGRGGRVPCVRPWPAPPVSQTMAHSMTFPIPLFLWALQGLVTFGQRPSKVCLPYLVVPSLGSPPLLS